MPERLDPCPQCGGMATTNHPYHDKDFCSVACVAAHEAGWIPVTGPHVQRIAEDGLVQGQLRVRIKSDHTEGRLIRACFDHDDGWHGVILTANGQEETRKAHQMDLNAVDVAKFMPEKAPEEPLDHVPGWLLAAGGGILLVAGFIGGLAA